MRSPRTGIVEHRRGLRAVAGRVRCGLVLRGILCAILLLGAAAPVRAADEPGVARVSLIEGEASYLRGDADDWTGVSVNAPLVTGDRFYAAADSRAEIQLDPSVYARLSSETEVGMLELGPDVTQVRVSIGLASFRVRRDPGEHHVEIDTPGAALVVDRAGVYRVGVERNGDTNVQVREGAATMYAAGEQYQLGEGRGASIEGIGDAARPRVYAVSGGDGFDDWGKQRDARIENAVSTQYVSQGIYGTEDLDANGTWQYDEQYGNVWRPDVDPGWAPYTDGRWVWVDPWGWTWLDYSSWGWAPFHYGRWIYAGGYWGWAPGPIVATPVYAPALVGWYGGGWGDVSVSVGVGFGAVGWTPLGWGEPCFPWWGGFGGVVVGHPWWGGWGGPRVYNNVVINKNVTINNYNFANRRNPGGFSTMPIGDFRDGRGRITPVSYQRQGGFRAFDGHVPVVPTRASLPATRPSRVALGHGMQPPTAIDGRRVVAVHTPSSNGQPSFTRKLPMLEHSQGTPLTPTTLRDLGGHGGRAPLVQSVANPNAHGRQFATVPETGRGTRGLAGTQNDQAVAGRTLPHEGGGAVASREPGAPGGNERAGVPRAGSEPDRSGAGGRQTLTSPGSRSPADGASTPRVGSIDRAGGGRTVARPPAEVDGTGRAMPVAPRSGGVNHTPYVAPRPAWNGSSGSSGARDVGGAQPHAGFAAGGGSEPVRRSGGSPYPGSAAPGQGTAYQGTRAGSPPHPVYAPNAAPAPRSYAPAGGTPPVGAAPPTGRGAAAMPHAQTGSRGVAPSVPSAPPPGRGGSSRNYFSQPRSLARWTATAESTVRARSAPTYRSTAALPRGYAAPQMRAPSAYAPRGYAAPQTSAPSAYAQRGQARQTGRGAGFPSSGGFTAQRSASSSGRSFSGGSSAGGMAGGGHFGGRGG